MGTSERGFDIRTVRLGDIPSVVKVHLASSQRFFLTFLGRSFLELPYLEIAKDPAGVFFVATSPNGTPLGFAAGVQHLPDFYRKLTTKRLLTFGMASIRAALRRPSIIPRLLRAWNAPRQASEAACSATLMSIAVAPEAKGLGAGKLLIQAFLKEMARRGIPQISLTTDRDNNAPTLRFYQGLGFSVVRAFQTREGRWLCEFVIETQQ